jgi:hypothetical protein
MRFTVSILALTLALALATSCRTPDDVINAAASNGLLTTEFPSYAPGATVNLQLHNTTGSNLGYNLCASGLERLDGTAWMPVREYDIVCTMELRRLEPRQRASFPHQIPTTLQAGQYRFVTTIEDLPTGERREIASNTFAITPRG